MEYIWGYLLLNTIIAIVIRRVIPDEDWNEMLEQHGVGEKQAYVAMFLTMTPIFIYSTIQRFK